MNNKHRYSQVRAFYGLFLLFSMSYLLLLVPLTLHVQCRQMRPISFVRSFGKAKEGFFVIPKTILNHQPSHIDACLNIIDISL